MSARDVRDVILARLPALGSPGERFFPDPDVDRERAWEVIACEYVEALQQFDRGTLERAFARVRDTHTIGFWPSPGKFRLAALALRERSPDPDASKRAQAEQLAEAYVTRYRRTSKVYREAKRDGWAGSLMDYVHSAASVQAQLVAKTEGISWDAGKCSVNRRLVVCRSLVGFSPEEVHHVRCRSCPRSPRPCPRALPTESSSGAKQSLRSPPPA